MKYDVFISCKSEDYAKAHDAYDFLVRSGLTVFFSDVSLSRLQNADYRKSIDDALEHSQHMVVVTSSARNVCSPWVEAEWVFFVNEKNSGRKQGNLLTLLVGSAVPADLPPSLRKYEAIKFDKAGLTRLLNFLPHEHGESESLPSSSRRAKNSVNRKISVGILSLLVVTGLALCANYFAHRPAQDNANTAPPSLAAFPTTANSSISGQTRREEKPPPSLSNILGGLERPHSSAPGILGGLENPRPAMNTPTPPFASSDPPAQSAPSPIPAAPTVSGKGPTELVPAPPPGSGELVVNGKVTVAVDSDLYWDATGERKGDAKQGQAGRILQIDRGNARCLVSFSAPINDSAWIAVGSLEPSNPR